ncbi:MAG: DUF202 domain-containing protein [Ornithinimicrobium sp.]
MPRPGAHAHTAAQVDPGLQPERTVMAWSRTALACCIVSAITVRWLPFYGPGLLILPALTLLAAVAITTTQQHRIRTAVTAIKSEGLATNPLPMLCLVGLCWALGAAGLALVWVQ